MIVTSQDHWVALYNCLKDESRKSDEKFVFIYASAQDCDSICALRILEVRQQAVGGCMVPRDRACRRRVCTHAAEPLCAGLPGQRLLKNDRIPYGFLPVTRYDEITADFFRTYSPDETVSAGAAGQCSSRHSLAAALRMLQSQAVPPAGPLLPKGQLPKRCVAAPAHLPPRRPCAQPSSLTAARRRMCGSCWSWMHGPMCASSS